MAKLDDIDTGLAAALLVATGGSIDEHLVPCPKCAGQLRAEMIEEYRPLADVCAFFNVSPAQVREAGAAVDGFGRVKCGVPYVTCMDCGSTFDGSTTEVL